LARPDKYIARLRRSRIPLRRIAAAAALQAFDDDESEAALFDALQDPADSVRTAAVFALVHKRPGRSMDPIVGALRARIGIATPQSQPITDARELFQLGLEGFDTLPRVEILATAFATESEGLKLSAVQALATAKGDDATRVLEAALADASPTVRAAARDALEKRAAKRNYAQLQRNLPREYGSKVDEIIGGSLWHQAAEPGSQLSLHGV
jgi:HEAT repeat protein